MTTAQVVHEPEISNPDVLPEDLVTVSYTFISGARTVLNLSREEADLALGEWSSPEADSVPCVMALPPALAPNGDLAVVFIPKELLSGLAEVTAAQLQA